MPKVRFAKEDIIF